MGGQDDDMVHSAKMGGALKILERMVNQNAEDEIFQDFKYWEVSSARAAAAARVASKQAALPRVRDRKHDEHMRAVVGVAPEVFSFLFYKYFTRPTDHDLSIYYRSCRSSPHLPF